MNSLLHFGAELPRATVVRALEALRAMGLTPALDPGDEEAVRWSAVARALDALEPRLDDVTERRFAERYVTGHPLLGLAAPLQLSQRGFAELLARTCASLQPVLFEVRAQLSGERLELRLSLREGLAPCPAFMRLALAVITHAPRAIGARPFVPGEVSWTGTSLFATWALPPASPAPGAQAALLASLTPLIPLLEGLETRGTDGPETSRLQRALELTPAEARVATALADGLTARETSQHLGISYQTVRTHLRNVNERLQLSSQRELIALVDRCRSRA